MDCIAEPAAAQGQPEIAAPTAAEPTATAASATLCMSCEVRARCLGGIAAEAGTAQLKAILAARQALRVHETLYQPDDRFAHVYAVRSGSLVSATQGEDGRQVVGFHFPGEVVGVDGMATGRQRVTVTAMADTQLCAIRFAPRGTEGAGVQAFLARLWDMMSCEMVRERAHQGLLATLPPPRRVAAFFASVRGRLRGRPHGRLPPGMGSREIASYLGVAPELVEAQLPSR
jgi:CRP/FNR family transcriptional regulator